MTTAMEGKYPQQTLPNTTHFKRNTQPDASKTRNHPNPTMHKCDSTAVLTKHGVDFASNSPIVPLVRFIFG